MSKAEVAKETEDYLLDFQERKEAEISVKKEKSLKYKSDK